ncbi:MAG: type I restriction endonuclease subunit R [Methanosarcinaceae archaeon]
MNIFDEDSGAEQPAIEVFDELKYGYAYGPDISPGGSKPLRESLSDVILKPLLKEALVKINGALTTEEFDEVLYQIGRMPSTSLVQNNKHCHDLLKRGVTINLKSEKGGGDEGRQIRLVDFENPENNDFFVSNQFVVKDFENWIRPDLVVFLNGFPVSVVEFKNPNDPNATLYQAYRKNIVEYKKKFPELFLFNEIIVLADDNNAKAGSLTSDYALFFPWKTVEPKYPPEYSEQEVLIREIFQQDRLLDIIDNFIVFDDDAKILAMYHQLDAVNMAVEKTIETKDGKVGVIWHTQGSGKSFSMVFYTMKLTKTKEMNVPTVLVVTDVDELDDQIAKTFARSLFSNTKGSDLRAQDIKDLRKKLTNLPQGGVYFTLIEKFQRLRKKDEKTGRWKFIEKEHPVLNERDNIIVIVDEAHRTQYGTLHRNMKRALPNARFIGFTGTPIEISAQHSTSSTFGDFISTYTITESERDGNTVPIYYDGRKAELNINTEEIDELFEDYIKNYREEEKEKFRRKWGKLSTLLGDTKRVRAVAEDIVYHFNHRKIKGKAMLVAVNRKTAVKYLQTIRKIPGAPTVDIAISGTEKAWKEKGYIKSKKALNKLRDDFKKPEKEPQLMIVCDMLLTGYSVSPLTTLYLDKPMKNHTLFQAITRVNRVFKDKDNGLIVDYIGIADRINEAFDKYSRVDIKGIADPIDIAISLMKEKFRSIVAMLPPLKFEEWTSDSSLELSRTRKKVLNEILKDEKTKMDFLKLALEFRKLFAAVSPRNEALDIEFEADIIDSLRIAVLKISSSDVGEVEIEDSVIENLVTERLKVKGIEDLVDIKGGQEVLLTSDNLGAIIREGKENENLLAQLILNIINNKIRVRFGRNLTKIKSFKERLDGALSEYNVRFITTAQLIERLIEIGEDIDMSTTIYERLELSGEEEAFYDILTTQKDLAIEDPQIQKIVKELTDYLRKNTKKIDWYNEESFKTTLKEGVKDILRKYGFKTKQANLIIPNIMKQTESTFGGNLVEI